jgi:serine/threonine protein kinase
MKALAKDPTDRFANVSEMQARLKEILQEEKVRLAKLDRLRPEAEQALGKEQWRRASDVLYKILDLAPDDPDVLQKLKIAQDQQQLMNLRHQIPRKMNDGLWQEAKGLLEEALRIVPNDATLATWQEKIDDQLTIIGILEEAEKAAKEEDWSEVIRLCIKALELDHSHAEALSLFRRAQTQAKITTLRQEAETLRQQGDKQRELETLKALHSMVPTAKEVDARIRELKKAIDLETYYAQGKRAYNEKKWEAAIEDLAIVVAIDKFHLDAAPMLLDARDQHAKELSVEREPERRQELQKLFDESEELIHNKQWQTARETLEKIRKDKRYRNAIAREELFTRLFYVLGRQYAEAREWYPAKRCFGKVLEYSPDYRDAKQQLAIARSNNLLKRNYRIKMTLGAGGTSQVDHAVDLNRGREVSLKYLTASFIIEQEAAISRRFRRQARRCMGLDHPNIVEILAVEMRGVVEDKQEVDVPVVVMEYIEGQNLAEFLSKTQGVPERQAIAFTCQLCQALQCAHERGILHLDIKPPNILIGADGLLKLTDFAYISHGTRGYRSPEQTSRSAKLDERADIFAAGKVLYALLTGKLPAEDPLDEEDPSFQRITPPLQAVIRKATEPDPKDRYQSAQEMFEALLETEAKLPLWLKFRLRVSDAWQVAKTWQGILAFIGVLLTLTVLPVLTAEDNTPLGVVRERVITYLSGTPTPIPRSIGETEFVVNGVTVVDVTQHHYVTDTRQINIEVRVQDADGETISDDEISCQWDFAPPFPEQVIGENGRCKVSYLIPEGLDGQLVIVAVQGKDGTEIVGMSANSINIILQSD